MACCQKLNKAFKKVKKYITDDLLSHANIAVNVVEKLKTFLESKLAVTITAIIPGDLDDKVRCRLIKVLTSILIIRGYIPYGSIVDPQGMTTVDELVKSINHSHDKDTFYSKLASDITKMLDDQKTANHIVDSVVQLTYSTNKLS
ncbi:hypothetical protein ACFS6H_16470 [Terrimonas rubra]|uniref:Uncharacterized protein n=1 Tax=Terrimonas rubra TaxID=1035890 RepID=A0ABW6AC47_9BACT